MSTGEKKIRYHETVGEGIGALRNSLLDTIYLFCFIASLIAVAVSVARVTVSGYKTIFVIDIIGSAIIGSMVVARKKIPYQARLYVLLFSLVLAGAMGMAGFGMFGYSTLLFIAATVLAAAFANRITAFSVLGVSAAVVWVTGSLFSGGKLDVAFDMGRYHRSVVSWLNLEAGLVAIGSMTVVIVTAFVCRLAEALSRRESSLREVKVLNETLEQKVTARTAELEQSNRDKDKILGVVAHDLNNKLVGVIGYLDMLDEDGDAVSASDRRLYVRNSLDASLYAKDIVQDLLEFARGLGDSGPLVKEPVDMNSFVMSTVECHVPKALEKKIGLKMDHPDEYLFCNINKTRFSRVIDNLITNAVKFTAEGGRVTVTVQDDADRVLISVKDDGIGIPDSLKSRLFEPFSTAGRPGTAHEKSTGLGLAISKQIVEQHTGELWFESVAGEGSTFFISLPKSA